MDLANQQELQTQEDRGRVATPEQVRLNQALSQLADSAASYKALKDNLKTNVDPVIRNAEVYLGQHKPERLKYLGPMDQLSVESTEPKEPAFVEKTKTFYVEDKKKVLDKELPYLKPIEHKFIADEGVKTPSSQRSISTGDDVVSFYEEVDQKRPDVPKIPNTKIYRRRGRQARPGEKEALAQEHVGKPGPGLGYEIKEQLVPSGDWLKGKPTLRRRYSYEDIRPKAGPSIQEKHEDFFRAFEIDPKTGQPKIQQDEGKVKKLIPTKEQVDKASQEEPKYMILKGPNNDYHVIKLNPLLEPNPLAPPALPEHSIRLGSTSSKSKKKGGSNLPVLPPLNFFTKTPFTFHDLPIYVSHSIPPHPMSIPPLTAAELPSLIKPIRHSPASTLTQYVQTDETMEGRAIVTAVPKIKEAGKDVDAMDREGRVLEGPLEGVKTVPNNPSSMLAMSGSPAAGAIGISHGPDTGRGASTQGSRRTKGPEEMKKGEVLAKEIEGQNGRPVYLVERDAQPEIPEEEEEPVAEILDENGPLIELKKAMEGSNKLSDVQGIYNNLARGYIEGRDKRSGQNKMIDRLFHELDVEARRRAMPFDDFFFGPVPSSLVNNSIKSTLPFKDLPWDRAIDRYENPVFLRNFNANELFAAATPGNEGFCIVLASLSDTPSRVRQLFSSTEFSQEGIYGLKLYPSGRLESVVVDDFLPYVAPAGGVIVTPANAKDATRMHHKGNKAKRLRIPENEVELWPSLVTKGLAKALGCYERLLNQKIENSLGDLTGMPVRTYSINEGNPTFEFIRDNFKRNYIQILETTPAYRAELTRQFPGVKPEMLKYFVLSHPAKPLEDQSMIAFKSPFIKSKEKHQWNTEQYLTITEDWIKYRRFKQTEQGWFWTPYTGLSQRFSRVVVGRYREDWHVLSKILESKNNGAVACDFKVKQTTSLCVGVVQADEACADPEYQYSTLRTFLIKLPADSEKDPAKRVQELVKGAYQLPSKYSSVEATLEPGKYRLAVDVETPPSEFGRVFSIGLFSDHAVSYREEASFDAIKHLKEFYSSLCIERGERQDLAEGGALRKYILSSPKLGIYLAVYANRSRRLCAVVEKLAETPHGRLSKSLEEGDKLVLSLPANGRKLLALRYQPREGVEEKIKISEAAYRAKGQPQDDDM